MHAFEGFKSKDFKTGVTGTTWRKELVKAICEISEYKSKIPFNYPEIYFGIGRHKKYQSKLYVGINEEMLYYGFYIEKGYPSERDAREAGESPEKFKKLVMDKTWDWTEFKKNINAINEKLLVASLKYGLITEVSIPSKPKESKEKTKKALLFRFRGIIEDFEFSPTSWCDLSILKEVEKITAVERGTKIVDDICEVFDMLHPIYAITSNNFGHRRKK